MSGGSGGRDRARLALAQPDEIDIARVDDETGRLAEDEHGIGAVDGVGEQQDAAKEAEIPERLGDDARPRVELLAKKKMSIRSIRRSQLDKLFRSLAPLDAGQLCEVDAKSVMMTLVRPKRIGGRQVGVTLLQLGGALVLALASISFSRGEPVLKRLELGGIGAVFGFFISAFAIVLLQWRADLF